MPKNTTLINNQTIHLLNQNQLLGQRNLKILRISNPVKKVIPITKVVKKIDSQVHQQALDVTPGLGFIKVIYPTRISLTNGYELVQRLMCNQCAAAGLTFSTFFPNILQAHEVHVHGKSNGRVHICQTCERFTPSGLCSRVTCAQAQGCSLRNRICKFCDGKFQVSKRLLNGESAAKLLKAHIDAYHGPTAILYQCSQCNYETDNEIAFNWHLKFHATTEKFGCSLCSMQFRSKRQLEQHGMVHFHQPKKQITVDCRLYSRKLTKVTKKVKQSKCRYCTRHFNLHVNRIQHEHMAHPKRYSRQFYQKQEPVSQRLKGVGYDTRCCDVVNEVLTTP